MAACTTCFGGLWGSSVGPRTEDSSKIEASQELAVDLESTARSKQADSPSKLSDVSTGSTVADDTSSCQVDDSRIMDSPRAEPEFQDCPGASEPIGAWAASSKATLPLAEDTPQKGHSFINADDEPRSPSASECRFAAALALGQSEPDFSPKSQLDSRECSPQEKTAGAGALLFHIAMSS